jgi:tetratricopeptide (TPR) repeat protein
MCISLRKRFFPLSVAEKCLGKAESSMQEYRVLRQVQNLRQAIQYYEEAYVLSNETHVYFTAILINYAAALNLLDHAASNSSSRSQIIDLFKEARRVMEKKDPRPPSYATVLSNLGQCYLDQYRDTKVEKDYRDAVNTFRLAQTSGSDPGPYLPASIGLAAALWTGCEFHHSKDEVSDLNEAIKYLNEALERSVQDSDTQAECFKNLGSSHNLLSQKTHDPGDLDKSVDYNEKAVKFLRSYDPNLAATTFNLSQQYYTRYTFKRNPADLTKAHDNNKKAQRLVEQGSGKPELLKQIEDLAQLISRQSPSSVDTTAQQSYNEGRSTIEAGPALSHDGHKPRRQRSDNRVSSGNENHRRHSPRTTGNSASSSSTFLLRPFPNSIDRPLYST